MEVGGQVTMVGTMAITPTGMARHTSRPTTPIGMVIHTTTHIIPTIGVLYGHRILTREVVTTHRVRHIPTTRTIDLRAMEDIVAR